MSKIDVSKIRSPMWWTVLVMVFSAIIGVLIGVFFLTIGLFTSVSANAGFFGPSASALASASMTAAIALVTGVVAAPIWALVGGWLFSMGASGKGGAARLLKLTFLAEDHPIHQRVNELAAELALPPIKWVGWFEDNSINAFAVGVKRENALIGLSRGAIEKLQKEEVDAIIGHELGHVASNDMARMTYARGVQEALSWFLIFRGFKNIARWLFTPLSELEILRHSRHREFAADAVGAALISQEAMKGALLAIKADKTKPAAFTRRAAHFMFRSSGVWATHPPLDKRIRALDDNKWKMLGSGEM